MRMSNVHSGGGYNMTFNDLSPRSRASASPTLDLAHQFVSAAELCLRHFSHGPGTEMMRGLASHASPLEVAKSVRS